jgi:hypothetical protein
MASPNGTRLDILSSCGGRGDKKQREENKTPGRLTAMHSSGYGSVNKIRGSVSRLTNSFGVVGSFAIVVLLAGTDEFTLTQKPGPGSYTQATPGPDRPFGRESTALRMSMRRKPALRPRSASVGHRHSTTRSLAIATAGAEGRRRPSSRAPPSRPQ